MLNDDNLYYGEQINIKIADRLKRHEKSEKTYVIPKSLEEVFGDEKGPEEF